MREDLMIFSSGQAIIVTAASNYAGTGGGGAGAGILDTGVLFQSFSASGGYGSQGVFGGSPHRFILNVSVGQMFIGPVAATLQVFLQDSADAVNWANTNVSDVLAETTAIMLPGVSILSMDIPGLGGSQLGSQVLRQFLRVLYVVANGPFTGGTVNAGIDVL